MPQREKAKAKVKAKAQKRRSRSGYVLEEDHVPTSEGIVDKTLHRLRNLGNQTFALSPFSEHFGRWLIDVRVVLFEFESSPKVSVDDYFVKERSRILSNVERELEKRRQEEASCEKAIKSLADNRRLLEQIEEEYTARTGEIESRKHGEIKRLSSNVDGLREEMDRISRIKTGIFRATSKKNKAQKEAEATQRLNSAQSELDSVVQNFTAEQEKLRNEYGGRKRLIMEQIRDEETEVENQDIDGSLETRQAACEALINAVKALLERKGFLG
jgi:chromosome segregation ATPase